MVACSILAVANCQLSQSDLQSQACEITIRVDSRVENNNWRDLYREYQETKSNYSSLDLTFSDLQETLLALNTTVFHRTNDCVEIIISRGSYSVSQSVYLRQNVRIIGEVPGEVLVDFNSLTVPENSNSSITIYGSDSVVFSGINFTTSPGIIFIERVTTVEVTNCSFQFFSFGPLDIYHCLFVQVHSCFFVNNGFEEIIKYGYQFRGHAGGLSIGFDDGHYSDNGTSVGTELEQYSIFITKCIFRNNTSKSQRNVPALSLFQRNIYAGRGGALTILLNSITPFDVTIRDCEFKDNTAIYFGGGAYIIFFEYLTHKVVLDNVMVERNYCSDFSGGGIYIPIIGEADNLLFSGQNIGIFNSTFTDNVSPTTGGGVYIQVFNVTKLVPVITNDTQNVPLASIKNCTFRGNSAIEFGSAISYIIDSALTKISNISNLLIEDCIFEENSGGRGGVVSIAYLTVTFNGTNEFHKNSGHVLLINGARIELQGSMRFVNNTPSLHGLESGSLYVLSFAQLQLFSGTELIFKNNSGILGASIAGDDVSKFSGSFAKTINNPLCVLSSENSTEGYNLDSPDNWNNIKIHFSENKALIGSAVLLSNIDICSWTDTNSQSGSFFNRERVFHWDFVNFVNNNVNRAHTPRETNPKWYVQTLATRIISRTPNVTAYPGEKFSIRVDGFDEYNQPIIVPVRLSDPSGEFRFSPSAFFPVDVISPNIESTFSVPQKTNINFDINKTIVAEAIYSDTIRPLQVFIALYMLPCPNGFVLQPTSEDSTSTHSYCMCNDEENINIQDCKADNTLILTDGLWGVKNPNDGENGDGLTTYPCPQHYCQCLRADNSTKLACQYLFNPRQPNEQCFCKRKGVLCGDCADESGGFSALLNKCKSCGVANVLLIIALLVVDVMVIGGLVIFLRTDLHSWFYPCLFYLQIIPYLAFYFPVTFEVVHPYVYYVSSATSFYFVYDFCLGPHLSPLVVYFVRLLPSLITITIAVSVIVTRYILRMKVSSRVPGLWLVVLLQNTHVIHTCMSVLNCPTLPGNDGIIKPRWFINGNIDCFTGGHIPLALLSIALLVISVVVVPTTMLFVFLRSKKRGWLYNIIVPSSDAYKKKYQWWGVVELLRRAIILLFAVALPGMEFWVIFFMIIVVGIYLFVKPYKTSTANIIEAFLATNMLVLLFMPNIDDDSLKLDEFINLRDYSSDNCIDSAVHTITRRAIMLTPCYYVPLFVIILATAFCALRLIIAKAKPKKVTEDITTGDYHLLKEDIPTAAVTSSIVDVDDDKTLDPLSRLWTSVRRKSSKKSISKPTAKVDHLLRARGSSLALQVHTENASSKSTSGQRETLL